MTTNNNSTTEMGCFGCVFWLAVFAIFCIIMWAAVAHVWDWAFG